jgi:hypothetical protein
VVVAQDSAIEVEMPIGYSFVCSSSPGVIVMAGGAPAGNTLASFTETPNEGDRGEVLFADSLGLTWLTVRPAAPPTGTEGCAQFADAPAGFTLSLREQLSLPPGAPLRFFRRTRLSLYRASDSRWYLGTRHWNAATQSFNAVQPVAGPLSPYSHDPGRTGLGFVYRDANNVELAMPVDPRSVAGITVTARSKSARFEDSTAITVALRNAQ